MSKSEHHDPRDPRLSAQQVRERVRGQVEIILEALGRENVGWSGSSDDPADFEYLYRRGALLVRDRDLDRVSQELPGEVTSSLISGLTRYAPAGVPVPEALAHLDRALGRGVATPDHVIYVTGAAGCCPAIEPEVPGTKAPEPPISTDPDFDGSGVMVSVVDTGWDPAAAVHPDTPWLAGVTGDLEAINPAAIHPYAGHGTFVAGVVRAMAPKAQIRVEGFLPNGGAVFESDLVDQLDQALALGPDIISMSAGTTSRNAAALLGFEVFWETRLSNVKGTVLVVAAGNDGTRVPFWPAAFPWTVSVGALDPMGDRASFSNFGSWVDVYAPGVDLVNAYPTGTFVCHEPPNVGQARVFDGMARWSGTSFATPYVAGLIAARMSGRGENARQAADALLSRARAQARPGVGAVLEAGPGSFA